MKSLFTGLILKRENKLFWSRTDIHSERKMYHCLMGLGCFVMYAFILNRLEALLILFGVGALWILFDMARTVDKNLNRTALKFFGRLMRKKEFRMVSSNTYYILGMFLSCAFFPKNITLLAILFLAIGDPVASYFGNRFGSQKVFFGKKSLEGCLANFIVIYCATFFVGKYLFHLNNGDSLILGFVSGIISSLVETLPFPLDDNLSIPVLSGVCLYLVNLGLKLI